MATAKTMTAKQVIDSLERSMARIDFSLDGTVLDKGGPLF